MATWLTQQLGIAVPVISAPMAGVANGRLAAAVSAAGALGMVGVGANSPPDWITEQCDVAAVSGRPWGVGLQAWAIEANPGQLDAVLATSASLVSINYGTYQRYLPVLQQAGFLVATAVGSLLEAQQAAESGVDLIIARGAEGGGHGRNWVGTLPLLQEVLDQVGTPVVAAGGIATRRGLAAVLAAGASGAWVGTAFLTCIESMTNPAEVERLVRATDTDTVYGGVFDVASRTSWPREFGERALSNSFAREWHGREDELVTDDLAAASMAKARAANDYDIAGIDAGQGVGLIRGTVTAAEVVAEFSRAATLF